MAVRNRKTGCKVYDFDIRAFSSAGPERSLHTRKVTGSNPVMPTTLHLLHPGEIIVVYLNPLYRALRIPDYSLLIGDS